MNGKELAELLEKVAEKAAKQTASEILKTLYKKHIIITPALIAIV